MKYLFIVLAVLTTGCDVELLPSPDGNPSQTAPIESPNAEDMTSGDAITNQPIHETLNGYDAETTASGETINDDGTVTRGYTVKIPVRHGKPIKTSWKGKVVAITDGDTIKVLNDQNEQIKVRLESIDTPERKQPYGEVAKNRLGKWIHEKTVVVMETGKDQYGRTLAFIELPTDSGDLDVCLTMIQSGFAWNYTAYSKSEALALAEQKARNEKRGLWASDGPDDQIPPWEWRKRK
ncbi:thermonuclease family protein [Mariniblastus sp.]|nr:thermonuclease family protein [Mariniblastus sp.]